MSARQQILDGLIAYYSFDELGPEATNPTVLDSSANARHLNWSGTSSDVFGEDRVELVPGIHGNAMRWKGTLAGLGLDVSADFSAAPSALMFAVWVNHYEGAGTGTFVSLGNVVLAHLSGGIVQLRVDWPPSITSLDFPTSDLSIGWNLIVGTMIPGGASRLWLNGVLKDAKESNKGWQAAANINISSNGSNYSKRDLDEIIFAERFATQADVDWLYNNGAGRSWAEVSGQITIPETPEEIFTSQFAEASGAAPWPSALQSADRIQRLADHNVLQFLGRPRWYELPVYIGYGELDDYQPGRVRTFRKDLPGLTQGKKLMIMGSDGDIKPGWNMLLCRG